MRQSWSQGQGGQSQQAQNHQTHDVWQDEISALAPMASPPDDIKRTIEENCRMLRFESFEFEQEGQ